MGRVFEEFVDSSCVFRCAECNAHLARYEDIISKKFQGTSGRAYLFDAAVNVSTGPPEERMLMTGLHVVLDLYCNTCWGVVGWKYVRVRSASFNCSRLTDSLRHCLHNLLYSGLIYVFLAGARAYMQKEAHNASEKYKEGKFILELAKTDQKP